MKAGKTLSILLFFTFSLFLLVGISTVTAMYFFRQQDKMTYGLQLAGQPVTGMTRAEVRDLLESTVTPKLSQEVLVLTYDNSRWHYKPQDIGLSADIPATVEAAYAAGRQGGLIGSVFDALDVAINGRQQQIVAHLDEARFKETMTATAKQFNRPARNASVALGANGTVVLTPGQDGLELDINALLEKLREPLLTMQLPQTHQVTLSHTAPAITTESLQHINTVLGSYSTDFTSASDRGENVRIATEKFNNYIVPSGAEVSFNKVVGPRDAANGYLNAPVIIGGRVEPGLGGGVCQVSSTLYNAILLAGLTPTDRQPHYYPSHYCPPGLDATVAYGLIDFCFKNTLPHSVMIIAYANGDDLYFHVLGDKADKPYDIYMETSNPAHNRYLSYRVYEQNGNEVKRELLYTDDYDDPPPPDKKPDPNKPKPGENVQAQAPATTEPEASSPPEQPTAPTQVPEEKRKKKRQRG